MRQPKIFLRNNNILETKNFNFGSTLYFKSWAERIGAKRHNHFPSTLNNIRKTKNKSTIMTYPFIPIGLISIFILVILYLLIIKKDMKQLKTVLYPGLFFIVLWAFIYYFLLK